MPNKFSSTLKPRKSSDNSLISLAEARKQREKIQAQLRANSKTGFSVKAKLIFAFQVAVLIIALYFLFH